MTAQWAVSDGRICPFGANKGLHGQGILLPNGGGTWHLQGGSEGAERRRMIIRFGALRMHSSDEAWFWVFVWFRYGWQHLACAIN